MYAKKSLQKNPNRLLQHEFSLLQKCGAIH
jgi:hypothetical protein